MTMLTLKNMLSPRGLRTRPVDTDPVRVVSLPVSVYETGDSFHILGDVPGVERKDVELVADGSRLTIRATVRGEQVKGYESLLSEYGARRLERVLTLPETIDLEHAEATLHDGTLHVVLPRSHRSEAKRITVSGN